MADLVFYWCYSASTEALFIYRKAPFALIAAAAENENDCKDNYPGAVVVKNVAKAIVVHRYVPPWSSFGRIRRLVTYYDKENIL